MTAKESYLAHDKQFRKILKELLNNTDRIMRNAMQDNDGDLSLADESVESLIGHAKRALVLNVANDGSCLQNAAGTSGAQSHPHLLHAYLSQCVRDQLSTAVRNETEQAASSGLHDDQVPESQIVDTCVRHLLESPQYRSFVTDLQTAIARVTEHMTLDYFSLAAPEFPEHEAGSEPGDPEEGVGGRWSGNFSHGGSVSSLADGESVSSSSYGAFWEMLSNDRLQDLTDRLGASDTAIRLDALRMLAALPFGEVVVFDNWPFMRAQLRRLLLARDYDDAALYECTLHVHAKMLRGGGATSFCTAEGFANVAEALRHTVDSLAERGVISTPPSSELDAVLRLAKLVNTFQRVAPRYWVRFADQHSRSVVVDTVRHLFDVHQGLATRPTPLHFLALLDPLCLAIRGWTKGEYGRRLLIGVLREHHRVLLGLISTCELYFDDGGANGSSGTDRPGSPHGIDWNHVRHCHVLFAINFIGALLRGSEGRRLVDESGPATGRQFLLDRAWPAAIHSAESVGSCGTFCLARTVASVLDRICADDAGCTYCFGDHRSVGVILDVLDRWLQRPPDRRCVTDNDTHVVFHAVELLGTMTESSVGLRLLLDHHDKFLDPSVSGVELVAKFAAQFFLVPDVPTVAVGGQNLLEETRTTLVLVGCRVLATHEGVQRLQPYQLLRRMAEEWESQLRRGESTPVAGRPSEVTATLVQRDWLGEMATVGCTPLGVAALREANLLQDVLDWTERELAKVKQASGLSISVRLMLSQVAAACCADARLAEPLSPAVDLLADVIWSACDVRCLDGGPPDSLTPASLESLELHARETLADLLCILPPRLAVTSALMTPPGAAVGSIEETGNDNANRSSGLVNLVISAVDGSTPSDDLAAETGLKLLSALGASLDTWLHLQGRHRLLEALLDAQMANVAENEEAPIVDNLGLRRGRLLSKMSEIGGEREKLLPPVTEDQDLVDVEQVHQVWPFISSFPLPDQYLPALPPLSRAPLEMELFLRETRAENLDHDWLVYCCEVFRNCVIAGRNGCHDDGEEDRPAAVQFRGQWYGHLLSFALAAVTGEDVSACPKANQEDDSTLRQLTPADHVGCQLVVSYGIRLGLLLVDEQTVDDLTAVLQSVPVADTEQGFDWLMATTFLLMCGSRERTLAFRRCLDHLPLSHRLVDWKTETSGSNSWLRFCHNVEIVLIGNHPLVFHALERSGLTVGQICYPWLRQCFWNVLDWEEICAYLGLCFVMGRSYQIYFVVAIFRHLQREVLKAAKDGNMALFFCETRLQGFRTKDYLPFMEHLESKYKNILNVDENNGE